MVKGKFDDGKNVTTHLHIFGKNKSQTAYRTQMATIL
jgi:hypothetical protein